MLSDDLGPPQGPPYRGAINASLADLASATSGECAKSLDPCLAVGLLATRTLCWDAPHDWSLVTVEVEGLVD